MELWNRLFLGSLLRKKSEGEIPDFREVYRIFTVDLKYPGWEAMPPEEYEKRRLKFYCRRNGNG